MRIVGKYSFKNGLQILEKNHKEELREIYDVIESIDAATCKTKISKEKTSRGKVLYSPGSLNKAFKEAFSKRGWQVIKVPCDYPIQYYVDGYTPPSRHGPRPYREMDFVKDRVGIEVQFGKYAFMVYNVAAKMTIFHNLSFIDVGVEIVPVKELQAQMSTGVSYFEQFVWDLEHRGTADIDIPVLVLGVMK
uniref:Restriction endonuclease BglII n=1 Tax=Acetithermum autotrophicum TaxID=1446466 RepID=H5SR92_ACEAU|nr:restriction endonuclease BglII [Candidatus Acetothermum autotrophicum]